MLSFAAVLYLFSGVFSVCWCFLFVGWWLILTILRATSFHTAGFMRCYIALLACVASRFVCHPAATETRPCANPRCKTTEINLCLKENQEEKLEICNDDGTPAGTCSCYEVCEFLGDCCPDYYDECKEDAPVFNVTAMPSSSTSPSPPPSETGHTRRFVFVGIVRGWVVVVSGGNGCLCRSGVWVFLYLLFCFPSRPNKSTLCYIFNKHIIRTGF